MLLTLAAAIHAQSTDASVTGAITSTLANTTSGARVVVLKGRIKF
jgi:hypothetical protein